MEKYNEALVLRQPSPAELDTLGKAFLALMPPGHIVIDEMQVDSEVIRVVVTQNLETRSTPELVDLVLMAARPDIVVDLGDIVAYGEFRIINEEKQARLYFGEASDKVFLEPDKPTMFFGGLFMGGAERAFSRLWALALETALRRGMSSIAAFEDSRFGLEIKGQRKWWADEARDEALCLEQEPEEFGIALKIVPAASFAGGLETLNNQGITVPEWVGRVPTLFTKKQTKAATQHSCCVAARFTFEKSVITTVRFHVFEWVPRGRKSNANFCVPIRVR